MNMETHEGSKSETLAGCIDAIYDLHHGNEQKRNYEVTFTDLSNVLNEYKKDGLQCLDIDAIIVSVKNKKWLSHDEISDRIIIPILTYYHPSLEQWFSEIYYLDAAFVNSTEAKEKDWYTTDSTQFNRKLKNRLSKFPASEENGYLDADATFKDIDVMLDDNKGDLYNTVLNCISVEPIKKATSKNQQESANQEKSFTQKGVEGKRKKTLEPRKRCYEEAKKYWEACPDKKIGEAVNFLSVYLKEQNLYCPTDSTIKSWLKEAEKDGELSIPKVATKAGRPKNS